ncbi:unnamed protein product, partial [Allacma fusca]
MKYLNCELILCPIFKFIIYHRPTYPQLKNPPLNRQRGVLLRVILLTFSRVPKEFLKINGHPNLHESLAAQLIGKHNVYSNDFKEFWDSENDLNVNDKSYWKQKFALFMEKSENIHSNSQRQPDNSEYAYLFNAGEDDTTAFGMSNWNNRIPDDSTYQPEMPLSNNQETRPLIVCHTNVPEIPDTNA